MYLIDTNVVCEARKGAGATHGIIAFFAAAASEPVFLSAISIGELRRGVDLIRRRGEPEQAQRLEAWLAGAALSFGERILPFDADAAQVWGRLSAPDPSRARQADRGDPARQRSHPRPATPPISRLGGQMANPFY